MALSLELLEGTAEYMGDGQFIVLQVCPDTGKPQAVGLSLADLVAMIHRVTGG